MARYKWEKIVIKRWRDAEPRRWRILAHRRWKKNLPKWIRKEIIEKGGEA